MMTAAKTTMKDTATANAVLIPYVEALFSVALLALLIVLAGSDACSWPAGLMARTYFALSNVAAVVVLLALLDVFAVLDEAEGSEGTDDGKEDFSEDSDSAE